MTVRILIIATAVAAMSVMFAHPSDAQVSERIKPFVADARLTWVRFKEDAGIASAIDVTADQPPDPWSGLRRRCALVSATRL